VWNFVTITFSTQISAHPQRKIKIIIIIKMEWNDNGNNKMEVNDCRK
jgi:hypothetical protein